MPEPLMVHVVDDDEAMLNSVCFLLEATGLRTRGYASALQLLATSALEPGCIVTDVRMPEMNGLELVRELARRGASHPVVVITGHADVPMAVEAMKAGVTDFIEKPFAEEALVNAVRAALQLATDKEQEATSKDDVRQRLAQLTPRERDVFVAVAQGNSNKEAARLLGISPRTVEIYRANVMTKMGAQSLSDLVRMALLCGE